MEIRFSLTPADLQTLADETVDARVKDNDQHFETLGNWQKRYAPALILGLALTCAALAPWVVYGRYTAESIIALLLAMPLLFVLGRRYTSRLTEQGQERNARIRQRSSDRLGISLHKQLESNRDQLLGVHVWQITPQALRMTSPGGQQTEIAWKTIACVTRSASFYRLASTSQRIMGLAYVIPRQSREMAAPLYEQGLAELLQHCGHEPS
ncbi:hypothetical protein [Pseudomonas sp. 8O]|uniref:hypothetical protein n=1 Tax=Pseudomonas sp. 8O TaxID=2653165 RepID=UPI0012F30ED2|nr:hypothetical protein [Pseudomonas sp. 8O]VXB48609.1 conserved hypothetical protein [Pseudomonas sp. 8O]